jgi:hypothetical protein
MLTQQIETEQETEQEPEQETEQEPKESTALYMEFLQKDLTHLREQCQALIAILPQPDKMTAIPTR